MGIIRNEKGAALITALMVMVVLFLLGIALWQYSIADTIHVVKDEQRMQAYYLARAGADVALQAWNESPRDSKPSGTSEIMYLDNETGAFTAEPPANEAGRFTVTIIEDGEQTTIESVGDVRGLTQTVTVTILSTYKYGHDLGWYDPTSGQMYDDIFEPFDGTVILKAHASNKLKDPNNIVTYQATAMFFESALGSPLNAELHLYAETIVFYEEIRIGNKGTLFLHLPEGRDEGVVYFKEVTVQNKQIAVSNKAYRFFRTIEVHNLKNESDIQLLLRPLINNGSLELILNPVVPSPDANLEIIWN